MFSFGIAYGHILNNCRARPFYTEQGFIPTTTHCKAVAFNRYIARYNGETRWHCMNAIAGPLFGNLNDVGSGAAA